MYVDISVATWQTRPVGCVVSARGLRVVVASLRLGMRHTHHRWDQWGSDINCQITAGVVAASELYLSLT